MKNPTPEELVRFVVTGETDGGKFVDEPNLHKALGSIVIRTGTIKEKCDFFIGELVLERLSQLDYARRIESNLDRAIESGIAAKSMRINEMIQRELEAIVKQRVIAMAAEMKVSATVTVIQ